jgi:tetratricopeptide (TPR) repeat protein
VRRGLLGLGVLLVLAAMPLGAFAGGTGPPPGQPSPSTGPVLDQRLTVGEITISYPRGLESQAKELAAVCQSVIPPRKAKFLAAEQALSDRKAIVERVVALLGCPEDIAFASEVFSGTQFGVDSPQRALFLSMFSNVHIYKESDLKRSGGIQAGPISLAYDPKIDKFTLSVSMSLSSETVAPPAACGFVPVAVRDDGTFRAQGGIAQHVSGALDELVIPLALTLQAAAIHEAAESILVVRRGFDHPFTRWFNEGTANWVALQVAAEVAPEHLQLWREQFLPGRDPSSLREKVNLLAWPQQDYGKRFVLAEEVETGRVSYLYATELVDRLLQGQPAGALAKVVGRLKGSQSPDTDAICQAFREVTGADAKAMLLEYVPTSVREGLRQDLPRKKLEEGYEALAAGDVWQALEHLQEALAMSPSDADAHLNLALAIRREPGRWQASRPRSETGQWQESERHIAIAAVLTKRDPSRPFQIHGPVDNEARYALGRAEQFRGRLREAKDIFMKLPKDHEDAQAALREIAEEERAPPPSPAGSATEPAAGDQR